MNLPPLHEALLDEPLFEALIKDIQSVATVRGSQVRLNGETRPLPFGEAVRWFREQQAQALQVQYLHQGVEWRDTLKRVPGGVRLVRMQIPSSQSMQRDG